MEEEEEEEEEGKRGRTSGGRKMRTRSISSPVGFVIISTLFLIICSSTYKTSAATLEKQCNEIVETGLSNCFAYIMGKVNPPPPDCCSQVNVVNEKIPQCLCLSIKHAFNDNQTGGVSFYKALHLGDGCNFSGLNASLCIGVLGLKPGDPLYGNITNPTEPKLNMGSSSHRINYASFVAMAVFSGITSSLFW